MSEVQQAGDLIDRAAAAARQAIDAGLAKASANSEPGEMRQLLFEAWCHGVNFAAGSVSALAADLTVTEIGGRER